MSSLATIFVEAEVRDSTGQVQHLEDRTRFAPGADANGRRQSVTLTASTFTSFTVPTGAREVLIKIPSTAVSLTLKGITGDTGTTIAPSSGYHGGTLRLTLGATPSIGIANGDTSDVVAELLWI